MDEVLIVGAGPTGLTLALDLRRRGVEVRLIDAKPGPSEHSKALAVFSRTLEALEDLQVAPAMIGRGRPLRGLAARNGAEHLADIDLTGLRSPFPFVLCLPQSDTEQCLLDRLARLGTSVEWNCELLDAETSDGHDETHPLVTAAIRLPDGAIEYAHPAWLVGCDGAHSRVRDALRFPYSGHSIPANFVFVDARADWSLPDNQLSLFFARDGAFAAIPLPARGFWRIIAQMPRPVSDGGMSLLLFEQLARERADLSVHLSEPLWMTSFGIQQRKVARYRLGRVILAGDAAHNHSPVGGQGMNFGIQDAYNLGWKLAMVIAGSPDTLLHSYEAEREPVARRLLTGTGLLTRIAAFQNPLMQWLRNRSLQMINKSGWMDNIVESTLSELNISYAGSPIITEDAEAEAFRDGPCCGARAPLTGQVARVNADGSLSRMPFRKLLQGGRHVLVEFVVPAQPGLSAAAGASAVNAHGLGFLTGDVNEWHELHSFAGEIAHVRVVHVNASARRTGDYVDLHRTVLDDYGVTNHSFYLIRPDGYIAYRGKTLPNWTAGPLSYLVATNVALSTAGR